MKKEDFCRSDNFWQHEGSLALCDCNALNGNNENYRGDKKRCYVRNLRHWPVNYLEILRKIRTILSEPRTVTRTLCHTSLIHRESLFSKQKSCYTVGRSRFNSRPGRHRSSVALHTQHFQASYETGSQMMLTLLKSLLHSTACYWSLHVLNSWLCC
jgi:hypothetical protein